VQAIVDPRLTLFRNGKNRWPSYCRNEGIKHCRGEFIAFLDSDCVAKPSWVEEIIKPFALDDAVMITSGKTLDPVSNNFWENFNKGVNNIASEDGFVNQAYTCNMAVRKNFITGNPFDESIPFSEDVDICFRCLALGYKIYYTQSAELFHYHRRSCRSTALAQFRWSIYNAYVRLRCKRLPHLNYGTYVLLTVPLGFIADHVMGLRVFYNLSLELLKIYLALIFLDGVRTRHRTMEEVLVHYLIFLLFLPLNTLGNIWGVCIYCKRKLFNQTGVVFH
jgi:GT2 family glycosyltransferase